VLTSVDERAVFSDFGTLRLFMCNVTTVGTHTFKECARRNELFELAVQPFVLLIRTKASDVCASKQSLMCVVATYQWPIIYRAAGSTSTFSKSPSIRPPYDPTKRSTARNCNSPLVSEV
jgi:hypothetical protein